MATRLCVHVEGQHPAPEARARHFGDPRPQLDLMVDEVLLGDRENLAHHTTILRLLLQSVDQLWRGRLVLISDPGDILTGALLREERVCRGIVVASFRRVDPVQLTVGQPRTGPTTRHL